MRVARKMLCVLVMAAIMCAMLATTAFAAETGSLWLKHATEAQKNSTAVVVCADTSVANGVLELRYDSSKLSYSNVEVSEAYVGAFSVNADTAGVVKIAWVAPGSYKADSAELALLTVKFTGKAGDSVFTVKGNAYDGNGAALDIVGELGGNADTADTIRPVMVLMALSVTCMAVCLTKKGWWAK